MEHFIKYVHINNFKSIADLMLEDCRRINLFIGYPNVGKSNVLEALSLFSVPFLEEGENLDKLIRVENKNELFHDISENNVSGRVQTNIEEIIFSASLSIFKIYRNLGSAAVDYIFSKKLDLLHRDTAYLDEYCEDGGYIDRYIFQTNNKWKSNGNSQLLPPFGENIIDTLSHNSNVSEVKAWIRKEVAIYLFDYKNDQTVVKRLTDEEVDEVYNYDVDLFFNIERYLRDEYAE
jgi:predicted ATPase